MKITLSKSQWEFIGVKTGWIGRKANSEQVDFPFYKDVPVEKPKENAEILKRQQNLPRSKDALEDLFVDTQTKEDVLTILNNYGYSYKEVKGDIIVVAIGKDKFIITDFEYPELKNAVDWLWQLSDDELENYYPKNDFHTEFWDYPTPLYHATNDKYAEAIKKNGLSMMDKTRGISNRSTGAAIFTSTDPDDIGAYGSSVFEIDTSSMKRDGYMPNVSMENPLVYSEMRNSLAHLIGLDNFIDEGETGDGLSNNTVIMYGNIPAKYLTLVS